MANQLDIIITYTFNVRVKMWRKLAPQMDTEMRNKWYRKYTVLVQLPISDQMLNQVENEMTHDFYFSNEIIKND